MRVKRLELHNFQAHKEITIQFSPSITTIKGASDIGKTAILRALGWVCRNDIAGDEFIREGSKDTTAILTVVDKKEEHVIVRFKSGRQNTYELDGEEFKAFGVSVPPDIASLLSIGPINFQGQHEAPFWFSESAPEVSRQLNAVIDLSVIDTTLANVGTEVRKWQSRRDLSEERLRDAKRQLAELEPQAARVDEFQTVRKHYERLQEANEDQNQLDVILAQIGYNQARSLSERANESEELCQLALRTVKLQREEDGLVQIINDIKQYKAQAVPPPDFDSVQAAFERWQDLHRQSSDLLVLLQRTLDKEHQASYAAKAVKTVEDIFHKRTKGKRCPICQNLIK